MPELPQPNSAFHGAHYTHIRDALPDWLTHATPGRLGALKAAGVKHLTAPAPLKAAIAEHWQQQNRLDQRLAGLNDVYAFAEPLLKHALRDYGAVDVRNTYLRLYVEANLAWWKINISGAQTSKTGSTEQFELTSPWQINEEESLTLTYDAVVSALSQPVTNANILSVLFVVEWA